VTATSGTLAGSPVSFTATGSSLPPVTSGSGVTWTKRNSPSIPGWNGWITLPYDPVSQQTLVWASHGGIYGSWMTSYDASADAFTTISWNGANSDVCVPDLPNSPGNRHTDGQMAIDTKRNVMWMFSGYNQNCGENYVDINGTQMVNKNTMSTGWLFPTAGQLDNAMTNLGVRFAATNAVQDPTHATLATNSGLTCVNGVGNGCNYQLYVTSGSEASPRQDMYYLTLNPDPKLNVWHQVTMP